MNRSSIEQILGEAFLDGNMVALYDTPRPALAALTKSISNAKASIFLTYFIFSEDAVGRELAGLLKKKAREGVRVWLLYDAYASRKASRKFWNDLERAGVRVDPTHPFHWREPLNFYSRTHWKLVIVDHEVAFLGGRNISEEHWMWRDNIVQVKGPVVPFMFEIFRKMWREWGDVRVPESDTRTPRSSAHGLPAVPIFTHSMRGRRKLVQFFEWCFKNAERSIDLMTPFFVPSVPMLYHLTAAARRGVRVRLLLPLKSDVMIAQYAARALFPVLMQAGVQVYLYRDRILHGKTYIFDGVFTIAGSANLDFKSLWQNDESNVGIYDEAFARIVTESFERDLAHSEHPDLISWLTSPFNLKIRGWIFKHFRKWL